MTLKSFRDSQSCHSHHRPRVQGQGIRAGWVGQGSFKGPSCGTCRTQRVVRFLWRQSDLCLGSALLHTRDLRSGLCLADRTVGMFVMKGHLERGGWCPILHVDCYLLV